MLLQSLPMLPGKLNILFIYHINLKVSNLNNTIHIFTNINTIHIILNTVLVLFWQAVPLSLLYYRNNM